MTADMDLDDIPGRPIGAQLAVIADRAQDFGPDLLAATWRETRWSAEGAVLLVDAWRDWRGDAREFARLQQAERAAHAQGAVVPSAKWDNWRKVRERRARLSAWAVAGLVAALTIVSAAGFVWLPWHTLATCATGGLLWLGLHIRHKPLVFGCPVPVLVSLPFGVTDWRWWPAPLALFLFAIACEQVGRRAATPDAPDPRQPGDGVHDWKAMWLTAERVLLRKGKEIARAGHARPIAANGREYGVAFGARCTSSIADEDIRDIERELGFPVNGSAWVLDPKAAGSGELRLNWEDPLPPQVAPRREPMSLRYNSKFPVAVREGGRLTEIGVGRQRAIFVGNSGGGKSQAMQVVLDAVSDMPDATWSGIDTQGGPTLPAYQAQWNCTGVHYTAADALAHIRELRALCIRRNELLREGMDEDLDGRIDQWWIVSDKPGHRGHVLFIDELSSFTADKTCRDELTQLLEVCRKASVSVVMGTPDLDTSRVPPAARDQAGIKVGFSMPFADAVLLFGKGSTQSGWEPYRFDPADVDGPNDAGKSFLRGAGYNRAETHRWFELPKDEIGDRNEARRHWRDRHVVPSAPPANEGVDVIDAEIVSDEEVSRLAVIRRAVELCGDRPGLPAAEAREAFSDEDVSVLRGVAPAVPMYHRGVEGRPRSHPRNTLVSALEA